MINTIKWTSTFLVLTGILLTNLNLYPFNIFIHGLGAVGWTFAGYMSSDKFWVRNSNIFSWVHEFDSLALTTHF
jgi:hypothetical protein